MNGKRRTGTKMRSSQRAVWRQSGCLLADTLVVIWKLTVRRNLSETPPERQAAGRYRQVADRQRSGNIKINKGVGKI